MRLVSRLALLAVTSLAPCQAYAQQVPVAAPQAEEGAGEEPGDEIIVQATRSGRRLKDEPVRVEVIDKDELDEKLMMRPGNVAMVLSETGGLRVQVTSPALGAANIRVQGMDGRYTLLLADGLPLYGGQASSLGLLQTPPTDLGQVEVIKGAASALYGPSALGGMINLVSRRPGDVLEAEVLLNASTRGGQDATAYASSPVAEDLGASITGGYHRQTSQDIDGDGWIDMASYKRWTVRPRLFWEESGGATAFLTAGAMNEHRLGGTLPGRTTPDGSAFPQAQDTDRFDGGLVVKVPVGDTTSLHVRSSAMTQKHHHIFGDVTENDRHTTLFAEASLSGKSGGTSWVGGAAWQRDSFDSQTLPTFNYAFEVPVSLVSWKRKSPATSRSLAAPGSISMTPTAQGSARACRCFTGLAPGRSAPPVVGVSMPPRHSSRKSRQQACRVSNRWANSSRKPPPQDHSTSAMHAARSRPT